MPIQLALPIRKRGLSTDGDQQDVGAPNYSAAFSPGSVDTPSATPYTAAISPRYESAATPNHDITADVATPENLSQSGSLRQALENPPILNRKPLSLGQRISTRFFGRIAPPEDQLNGVQEYKDALANYNAKISGLSAISEAGLRAAQASQYSNVDLALPGQLGTVSVPQKSAGQVLSAAVGAQGRQTVAEINKRFQSVPNVGLFDTQSRSLVPETEQGIIITPEIAKDQDLPPEFVGKPLKLSDLSGLMRGKDFQNKVVEGANGPAIVNTKSNQITPLGLGNPSLGHAVQVSDPNNPGSVTYTTAGNAIRNGAQTPQSAPARAARSMAVSSTSGPIGGEINAYNTAMQHAELLKQALVALNNGDMRTLNNLKNSFRTEFGSPDVTNVQAIANAYSREITKMLSAGHMTDAEIGSAGATMPTNASPQQMLGALEAYQNLATSKMRITQQRVQQGLQGHANFPAAQEISEGATATGPNGHKIRFSGGRWVDAATGQ